MSFDAPEEQSDITGSNSVTAAVATSCGEIALDLNSDEAPEHVNSFMFWARQGFYDGQVINRIRVNFGFVFGDQEAKWDIPTHHPRYRLFVDEGSGGQASATSPRWRRSIPPVTSPSTEEPTN